MRRGLLEARSRREGAVALGLVAAIPAVVIYNHFARAIAAHRAVVADSAAALLRVVSRDLSRGTLPEGKV